MPVARSFKDYVSSQFYNEIFDAAAAFIEENTESLRLETRKVDAIGSVALTDIEIKTVNIEDRPGLGIGFVILVEAELEVSDANHRSDKSAQLYRWLQFDCEGNLANGLQDWSITNVQLYDTRKNIQASLDDALVPVISKDQLDEVASAFLEKYYPEALQNPMYLDPMELARRMGLKVELLQLTEDYSIFGEIFFSDCEAEVYDPSQGKTVSKHFSGGTMAVDPNGFYLRNLGSVNNTIVHECSHWELHRKAFELERLYNAAAYQIRCQVVGGIKNDKVRTATDWMEWQANALAPRIQMPIKPFRQKVQALIQVYRTVLNATDMVDIIEPVIQDLATFYGVSLTSAKIRMVEAGFEEAIGAFTYVDGKYIKPYSFKKGAIDKTQTYAIPFQDALIEATFNPDLKKQLSQGKLVFVDAHLCVNDPKYITTDEHGQASMTRYALLHADECCVAFDLKVKSTNKYGETFYRECALYRDANSGVSFEAHFNSAKSGSVLAQADQVSGYLSDVSGLLSNMPHKFNEAFDSVFAWSGLTEENLAERSYMSARTIQRIRREEGYIPKLSNLVALCIGMQLPPVVSRQLIDLAGYRLLPANQEHLAYDFLLSGCSTYSIEACNDLLSGMGFDSLGNPQNLF